MVGGNKRVGSNDRVSDQSPRGDRAPSERVDLCECSQAAESPELARALELVQRIGEISIPQTEIDGARERVRARVFTAIAAQVRGDTTEEIGIGCDAALLDEDESLDISATVVSSLRVHPCRAHAVAVRQQAGAVAARRRAPPRAVFVAAAVLVLGLTGLLAASHAAATALPGAPLYSLKRGEEWLALRTAWSDTRRGEVLSEIAHQRLGEAQAEAAAGNAPEVSALTVELDDTMRALIDLTVRMDRHHEYTGAVTAALSQTFADERVALAQAVQQGQTALVQSLTSAAQDQQQELAAANLSLPSTTQPVTPVPSSASPTTTPQTTPTPTGSGQPVTPSGPTQGQGSGQGLGGPSGSASGSGSSGTGRGGSQGLGPTGLPPSGVAGTPTPTPTPTPVPGPYGPFGARRMI